MWAAVAVDTQQQGISFFTLDPDYDQNLFAVTSSFRTGGGAPMPGYLGGVVVMQNGDVVAAECDTAGTRLHRFSATSTFTSDTGQVLHTESIVGGTGGCGLTAGMDGYLYSNMNDGRNGVARIDPATGAATVLGPPGNALGIATDPRTGHIVYAGAACKPAAGRVPSPLPPCVLFDLDPATRTTTPFISLDAREYGYIDGIAFEPVGNFLFLTNRLPSASLVVIHRPTGGVPVVAQRIPAVAIPIGIAFHAASPKFVLTNNEDGTTTRFDFSGDDYTAAPSQRPFSTGGFRGDLMQAGPDGCVYVTQDGTRYDDGDQSSDNSIVRICGGFATLPPIVPWIADVSVSLSVAPTVTAGGSFNVSIAAANNGPDAAASPTVTASAPAGMTFTTAHPSAGWTCSTSAGTLTCTTATMAAGESLRIDATATAACPFAVLSPHTVSLRAAIASSTQDPSPSNNSAAATTQVVSPAPVISGLSVDPNGLWPPNHKMKPVTVSYAVAASCGGVPSARLDVTSNQGTSEDWQIVDAHHVQLRSERLGTDKSGRIYTITLSATDPSGSNATSAIQVAVPHNQ
jgi:hypothetical protein